VPRNAETIDDGTPLTASRIDIAARIGWLLRTSRSLAGLSLREMSAALKAHDVTLSATSLSRIESEGQRSVAALDGYAAVLGLPYGALRSPVDALCRSFSYAPPAPPEPVVNSLQRFSHSVEAIMADHPFGGAWLEFARHHASDGGFGLPTTLMEPHVRRLADELGRSVAFTARLTRYEALALLRCSAYGDLVDSVLREMILDPDAQAIYDLTSVLSESPTPALLQWAGTMLRNESIIVARGASYALQSMLVIGGLPVHDWEGLVPHFARAWHDAGSDPTRRTVLTDLCAALPPPVQAQIRETCRVEAGSTPGSPPEPPAWSRSRRSAHHGFARSIAADACARLRHHEEPLLERLLLEAMFDPRGVRMATSTMLLASSPFARVLAPLLVERRGDGPDAASRPAALRIALWCHNGEEVPDADALLEAGETTDFELAVMLVGRSGRPLPHHALERGLSGAETTVRKTLQALAMAEDPRLGAIASDRRLPESTRRGARWWLDRSGRILE
jgi:transcriptional regulator with XRE-family HTH domain